MANQVPNAPNQAVAQSGQNYKIDIDKIYADFIQEIDAVRSYVNSSGITLSSIQNNSISVAPQNSYQESRCHAFFRLIGFPVTNSGQTAIYNPGHPSSTARLDTSVDACGSTSSVSLTLDKKFLIAGNPIKGFGALSQAREKYPLRYLATFNNNMSIDASVLALSSGGTGAANIRKFAAPFLLNTSNNFDVNLADQSYSVTTNALVGKNTVSLNLFTDNFGNTPNPKTLSSRSHFIRPFIVDPIIDFTVSPSTRKVGIPFLPDKSYLKMASNVYVKRPLLEKVIRDRFSTLSQLTAENINMAEIVKYVTSITDLKNQSILSQLTANDNTLYKLDPQSQFSNFLNIIQEMVARLVQALNVISKAQGLYYWVPQPSTTGPEGGVSAQDVFLTTTYMEKNNLATQGDKNILLRVIATQTNQLNSQAANATGTPDTGGFAFDSFKTTFNADTSSALIDVNQQGLSDMVALRNGVLNKAGASLRIIEIIMGEFSGLGLCDIIAVMGALYSMPTGSLLGLLDDDAFARFNAVQNYDQDSIEDSTTSRNSYPNSIKDLETYVNQFYQLMDSIYQIYLQQSGLAS